MLPQCVCAQVNAPGGVLSSGFAPGRVTAFALAPTLAPAFDAVWFTAWSAQAAVPTYHSMAGVSTLSDDPNSPSFDIGGYDAIWDDTMFGELAAYGGLERDVQRVAGMRAIDGSDGASEPVPYGRLTLARDFLDGQHQVMLGAYGTDVSVTPTAISGFGSDSYMDVALDATWRWTPHSERSNADTFSANLLVLHEDQDLIASHAIFGTRLGDDLTEFRGDASWSWGGNITPAVQFFRITGSFDPVRLGTPEGSPNSEGFIAEINYLPSNDARSPLDWFGVRLSLEFVAYSEFDGSGRGASQNDAVLLHLTAGSDSGS